MSPGGFHPHENHLCSPPCCSPPLAASAAGIEITAKEKTLDVDKGEKVDLRRGDVRRRDKSVQVVMMHPQHAAGQQGQVHRAVVHPAQRDSWERGGGAAE
jgi:hypothetical protein